MSDKLRLDFVLKQGVELVEGDLYSCEDYEVVKITKALTLHFSLADDGFNNKRFITSFADRENEGEKPVENAIAVDYGIDSGKSIASGTTEAYCVPWKLVTNWKPNYDALLKMQIEHDKKESEMISEKEMKIVGLVSDSENLLRITNKYTAVGRTIRDNKVKSHLSVGNEFFKDDCTTEEFNQCIEEMSEAKWMNNNSRCDYAGHLEWCKRHSIDTSNKKLQVKQENVYTQAMFDAGEKPLVGMKVKVIHYNDADTGAITYIGKDVACYMSYTLNAERSLPIRAVKFRPIDTRTPEEKAAEELSDAKVEQVDELSFIYSHWFDDCLDLSRQFFRRAQESGHLAEIILPLEV